MWKTRGGPAMESSTSFLRGLFDGMRGPRFSSILMRRAEAVALGGYDAERHGVLCDTGMWGRVALLYDNVACINEYLVQYRVHAASETQAAGCAAWQGYCDNIHEDYISILRSRGDAAGEKKLNRGMKNHLANITVTVLMRYTGRPGWIRLFAREFWRSRRFMFTPFVAKRVFKDGWKLFTIQ